MSEPSGTAKSGKKRAILLGLGVLLGLVVLLVVGAWVWISSEAGRRYVSKRVESYATQGMGGSLKIGSIDAIDLFEGAGEVRVNATDVRFFAPDGREAMHVAQADVLLNLVAIIKGTVDIREAIAANGTVMIEIDADGKLSLEKAFMGPEESPESDSVGLNLRHMNARNMRVVLKPAADQSYQVVGIDGTVFVTRPRGGEFVTTELVDVSGQLEAPKFLGDTLSFSKLKGRIANNQTPMVKMSVRLRLDEGTIDTELSVEPDAEPAIHLKMHAQGDSEVKFLTSVADLGSFFGSDVAIETGPIQQDSEE